MGAPPRDTRTDAYTARLKSVRTGWKRWLNVQAPYRWNLRRLKPGFTLDIGCGVGRNLEHLGGHGIGVDHNPHSVTLCRERGLRAFTPEDFLASPHARTAHFDSLLFAHVLEHMHAESAAQLVGHYLRFLRAGGRLLMITPQQAGFRSDATHVEFMGFEALQAIAGRHGLEPERAFSFPFPRAVGRVFVHNEFVVVATKPD